MSGWITLTASFVMVAMAAVIIADSIIIGRQVARAERRMKRIERLLLDRLYDPRARIKLSFDGEGQDSGGDHA